MLNENKKKGNTFMKSIQYRYLINMITMPVKLGIWYWYPDTGVMNIGAYNTVNTARIHVGYRYLCNNNQGFGSISEGSVFWSPWIRIHILIWISSLKTFKKPLIFLEKNSSPGSGSLPFSSYFKTLDQDADPHDMDADPKPW